jgi:hypothetical protein
VNRTVVLHVGGSGSCRWGVDRCLLRGSSSGGAANPAAPWRYPKNRNTRTRQWIISTLEIVLDMSVLSRSSLASIVCPSAPFLAPRYLCAPARITVLHTSFSTRHARLQRPTYATKAPKKKPKANNHHGMRRPLKPDVLSDHVPIPVCLSMGF